MGLEEFIIFAVFLILVAVLIPFMFHKYPGLFYATESHIIYAKDLVRFISNCTWIELNKIHYDKDRLHIVGIDEDNHDYCVTRSLGNTYYDIQINKENISLSCILDYGVHYAFERNFESLNDKWDFTDDPNFIYIQNLYEQMLYAEALCYRYKV